MTWPNDMDPSMMLRAQSTFVQFLSATAALLIASMAVGQTTPPASGGTTSSGASSPSPQPGSPVVPSGSFGFPELGNGTIGGGNATESSAHPVTGDKEDSFDFGTHSQSGDAVHGSDNGPIFLANQSPPITGATGEVPSSHVVRRGDTLWGICDEYYRNPYEWPRLWSYNPDLKNPNWIYPGDELRLKPTNAADTPSDSSAAAVRPQGPVTQTLGGFVNRRRTRVKDTISSGTRVGFRTDRTKSGGKSRARRRTGCSSPISTKSTCTSTRATPCTLAKN